MNTHTHTSHNPIQDLQNEFLRHGVRLEEKSIPEVLQKGADAFLKMNGVDASRKDLTQCYLILDLLKNG